MSRRFLQFVLAGTVFIAAIGLAFFATSLLQERVPIVPGADGCFRLDGYVREVECLSDEFVAAAGKAADEAPEGESERAILNYVASVDERAEDNEQLAGLCHPAMHELGRQQGSAAVASDSTPQFPERANRLCTAGYVHGLAEGYVAQSPDADIASIFPVLCEAIEQETGAEGCAHGLGHAVLQAQGDDKPLAQAITDAKSQCSSLPRRHHSDCESGIFMELAIMRTPKIVPVDEFAAVCGEQARARTQVSCFGYLGLSLSTNDNELSDTPDLCRLADIPAQRACFEGYGRDLGPRNISECERAARAPLQRACITGAIALHVGSQLTETDDALNACERLTERDMADYCSDEVTKYASALDA